MYSDNFSQGWGIGGTIAIGVSVVMSQFLDTKYDVSNKMAFKLETQMTAQEGEVIGPEKARTMQRNFRDSIFYSRAKQSPQDHRICRKALYAARKENYPWWGQVFRYL